MIIQLDHSQLHLLEDILASSSSATALLLKTSIPLIICLHYLRKDNTYQVHLRDFVSFLNHSDVAVVMFETARGL